MNKKCNICGKDYVAVCNVQKYCKPCSSKKCVHCGKLFAIPSAHWSRKFCSMKCRGESIKGLYPINLKGKRGTKPRTAHLKRRPRHEGAVYDDWRIAVFKRDNFTCVKCGNTSNELKKEGIKICADHIKPYCNYPELRHEISNGRTLCVPCHKQTETYGYRAKYF